MGFVDSFIKFVSPTWAAQREAASMVLLNAERVRAHWARRDAQRVEHDQLVGYDRTNPTPRSHRVEGQGAAPDWKLELGYQRRMATDQARQLECNNSLFGSLLDRAVEHIIGEGLRLKCKSSDEGWNRAQEAWFAEWSAKADSRGVMTFAEIQAIVCRSWFRDGDVGTLLENEGTLRVVESDEIASQVGGYYSPSDADGVELDRKGRIVAYHVFDYDPSILWPDRRRAIPRLVRVPAESMIFLARRQRAGQTRGLSVANGIVWMLEQLDDLIEAVAVQEHMAACFGLVINRKTPIAGLPGGNPYDAEMRLGPGRVLRVDPGETVQTIAPASRGAGFDLLMLALMRFASARFGESIEATWFNFDRANYSNMRAQSLETSRCTRIKQKVTFSAGYCSPIWGWKLSEAVRQRKRDLFPLPKDFTKHSFAVPGTAWSDPEAELRTEMGAVDGVLGTRRAALERRGYDFDEVVAELAEEEKKIKAAGLVSTRSGLTRDAVPTTKTISEPEDPKAPPKSP